MAEHLYRIELHYAVFGILVTGDIVTNTAPIGRWMRGKEISFIRTWVEKKGGRIARLGPG